MTTADGAATGSSPVAAGRRWLAATVLVAAVALAFGNALRNDFVYDDRLLIVDNAAVVAPIGDLKALRFYRPLRTLSYRLDYAIGGLDPRVFHLSNLVYHALTALTVGALVEAAGASPGAALAGALVFAVHPVQTDAVTYAAGRRDILCGLFFAAGFLAYLRYRESKRRLMLAAAAAAYLLAILAKEMAITLPLVCLSYDRFASARAAAASASGAQRERPRRASMPPRGTQWLLAGLAAAGVAIGWTVYGRFLRKVVPATPWHGGSPGANLATVLRVWMHYLWLLVWPARLSADYSQRAFPVSTTLLDPRAVAAAVVLAALAFLASRAWRAGGLAGFGAAWCAVTLLPVSHLIPYRELLAEHYLYVPMIGVACVVAGGLDGVAAHWPGRRRLAFAAVGVLVVAATARTIVRNRDWRDTLTLWSATVAAVPDCARARFNLGQAYFARVRLDDAEREWRAAAELTPNDLDTLVALAALYYRQGRFADAEHWADLALARSPADGRVQNLAGWIALDGGDPARALPRFDAALGALERAGRGGPRVARERAAAGEGARLGRERAASAVAAEARRAGDAP